MRGDGLITENELHSNLTKELDNSKTGLEELASTDLGKGASKIGIHDADGNFTSSDVEGALSELSTNVSNSEQTINDHTHSVATTSVAGFMSDTDRKIANGNSGIYTVGSVSIDYNNTKSYNIPLGYNAQKGYLYVASTATYTHSGIVFFNTNDSYSMGISGDRTSVGAYGQLVGDNNIVVNKAYIIGSNLFIEFKNITSSTRTLGAKIYWVVN